MEKDRFTVKVSLAGTGQTVVYQDVTQEEYMVLKKIEAESRMEASKVDQPVLTVAKEGCGNG